MSRTNTIFLGLSIWIGGCSFHGATEVSIGDAGDTPSGPDAMAVPVHLLISEVKNVGSDSEFIEIYNPTDSVVALDHYYLSDTRSYALLPRFARIPVVVDVTDFIVQFPPAAMIGPGEVQVIGVQISKKTFSEMMPDYYIGEAPKGSWKAMAPAFEGSLKTRAGITDTGESIVLFSWDQQSDLVVDVDMIQAGNNTGVLNHFVNKAEIGVDGPDTDSIMTFYRNDLSTMSDFEGPVTKGYSFERIALEEVGNEHQSGPGNGFFGHDESSEDTSVTWQISAVSTPGTIPDTLRP